MFSIRVNLPENMDKIDSSMSDTGWCGMNELARDFAGTRQSGGAVTKNFLPVFEPSLEGLARPEWIDRLEDVALDHGEFEPLGPDHSAAFIEGSDKLLVSFEYTDGARLRDNGEPLAFDFTRRLGWSSLTLVCDRSSWFRHKAIYSYFDRLIDDGFFDAFEDILFYGVSDCGYAACAYSVSAPGARVLAVRPQATLSAKLAGWDNRFRKQRIIDFESRYGYAPDMIEGAQSGHIVFDPYARSDAAHAALFKRNHTTLHPFPILSSTPERDLERLGLIAPLVEAAMEDRLTPEVFQILSRARRTHLPYLRRLVGLFSERDRPDLVARVCRHALRDKERPFFRQHLEAAGGS